MSVAVVDARFDRHKNLFLKYSPKYSRCFVKNIVYSGTIYPQITAMYANLTARPFS